MTRKTNVHYDSWEFLHNDTSNGKAETQCILEFHISKSDIKGLKLAFESDYLKKKLYKLIKTFNAICDDEETINFVVKRSCVCSINDNYNEKLGEYVSLTKCQAAAFRISHDFIIEFSHIIDDDILEELFNIGDNMEFAYRNHIIHYNKLSDKEMLAGLDDGDEGMFDYLDEDNENGEDEYFNMLNEPIYWNNFIKNL